MILSYSVNTYCEGWWDRQTIVTLEFTCPAGRKLKEYTELIDSSD